MTRWKKFWDINGYFNWWSLRSVGNLVILAEPNDKFDASLDHCKTAYNSFASSKHVMGRLCASTYIIAIVLFATMLLTAYGP
jgi:hypothetical protein